MPLFDSYVMVDWSAASSPAPADPKRARDSIWWAVGHRSGNGFELSELRHARTRREATALLADRIAALAGAGRVLVGFDFAFGYPRGTGAALGLDGLVWRKLWERLSRGLEDQEDNGNNRFAVAAAFNSEHFDGTGPFWGFPPAHRGRYPGLPFRKPVGYGNGYPPERRTADRYAPGAKSVWQLSGAGVVGGQVLLGLPTVWRLRTDPRFAGVTSIWPFETGLRHDPRPGVVLAEIYPSQWIPRAVADLPKDAGQVATVVEHLAALDARDVLAPAFDGAPDLTAEDRAAIESEEAWILGLTEADARPRAGLRFGEAA